MITVAREDFFLIFTRSFLLQVMSFCEHDLASLIDNMKQRFTEGEVKVSTLFTELETYQFIYSQVLFIHYKDKLL